MKVFSGIVWGTEIIVDIISSYEINKWRNGMSASFEN